MDIFAQARQRAEEGYGGTPHITCSICWHDSTGSGGGATAAMKTRPITPKPKDSKRRYCHKKNSDERVEKNGKEINQTRGKHAQKGDLGKLGQSGCYL